MEKAKIKTRQMNDLFKNECIILITISVITDIIVKEGINDLQLKEVFIATMAK